MAKKRHSYSDEPKDDDLILGQEQETNEQAFDGENRPDPSVEDDLRDKKTPFNKVDFPDAPENYNNFEELLASDEYKHALDKLQQIKGTNDVGVGANNKFMRLAMEGLTIVQDLMNTQSQFAEQFEELAERVVRDYFKIPEESLQFNFKLVDTPIKPSKPSSKEEQKQKDEELVEDINELSLERAKRRLINAMTQGHSVEQSYMFTEVADELVNITGDDQVIEKYSIVTAMNILGYWHFPKELIGQAMSGEGEDMGGGKTKLDSTTNPPTVNAESVIFPFLIHEGIKGVMEYLGKERNPEDEEKSQKAMELEDHIVHEIWDIRLGPAIWRKLVSLFPSAIVNDESKRKLQFYIYSNIANLPVRQFLKLMKEVLQGSEDGRALIGAMYYDLTMVLDDEEVTNDDSHFKTKMNELMQNTTDDDDDMTDFLSNLGISLSDN